MDPSNTPRRLRPIEVRRLLGIGRTTLHDWTVAGRLTAEPLASGHRRYPADQPILADALAGRQGGR